MDITELAKMGGLLFLAVFLSFYVLWILYLAVMNLARARNEKKLTKLAYVLGVPLLWAGLVLDGLINIFLMTPIMLELPRELTVTSRLQRHKKHSKGWRLAVVEWFEPLLDPFDPDGNHV